MSLKEIRELWYRIWFAPRSPAPICLFRILLGAIALLSSLTWLPDLLTWFGYDGIVSIETMQQFQASNRFTIFPWLPPDNNYVFILYGFMFVTGLSFTLGFRSNLSALLFFLCLTSFHHRNLMIFHSGDTLLRVCLFLLIFGPIGKMYSIDSWLAGRKNAGSASERVECSPWVQNLLRFQIAIVYAQSSIAKIQGDTWWDGTAVYYATCMEDFHKFPVPIVFDHVAGFQIATWATLAIEIALWTLIWVKEFRYWVLGLGVLLHLGIDWTMNLPFFETLMIATYVLFLNPQDVERAVSIIRRFFTRKPQAGWAKDSTADLEGLNSNSA